MGWNAVVGVTSSVHIVALFFSSSVLFGFFGSFVHCQELINGIVSQTLRDVDRRATNSTNLPPSLSLDVRLGQRQVHLRLLKKPEFEPRIPVVTLTTDDEGNFQTHTARLVEDQYAVYQDVTNEAAFGVFREKDDNDTLRYKLEGIVYSEGQEYRLKSTGRHRSIKTRRRPQRRDVPDGDNNADNQSDGDSDEEEEEVEEEFEVHVTLGNTVLEADFIRTTELPPLKQGVKTMITLESLHLPSPPVASRPSSFSSSSSSSPPPPLPLRVAVPTKKRSGRVRRQTVQVYIDVVAMVDYGSYKRWYDRSTRITSSEKEQDALENIRRYYAFVMNGVDLLYKRITSMSYKINVRLVSIIVSTTTSTSTWTEQYRVRSSPWDQVDAHNALTALKNWAFITDTLPAYDHLMLFTGYDLTSTFAGGVVSTSTAGLAYVGTVCDTNGQATSVIEDLGGLQCVGTATHELGHGLSAEHDGYENSCLARDRYIMSAGTFDTTAANKLNPWKFSTCSVNYFNSFLRDRVTTARGRQCLYNTLTVAQNVPDVTSQIPGQVYDPDTQCRQRFGSTSYYCRSAEFGQPADICTAMYCFNPSTSNSCTLITAARGTTCGSQKWCQNGLCVSNASAPVANDNCVYGDQPGTPFQGQDCATFVDNAPYYCYQSVVRSRCCSSCAKHYQAVTDCEYGDRSLTCRSTDCPYYDDSSLNICCRTCNHGTTFIPPTTTILTPPGASTVIPQECVDDGTFTFNQMTCSALVASQPHFCYDSIVRSRCCLSCQRAATGATGCEYGDSQPTLCGAARTNLTECATLQTTCCSTCAAYRLPSGGQEASAVVNAYVTLSVAVLVTAFMTIVS